MSKIVIKVRKSQCQKKQRSDEEIEKEVEEFIKRVSHFFDKEIVEEKARETRFVQRTSAITGHLFLAIFTFAMSVHGTPSLNQLVGLLNALLPEINVSREAFHQRINKEAVTFFETMLSLAVKLEFPRGIELPVLDSFERILIFDSTSFQLPENLASYFKGSGGVSSKSAIKIVFGYDFKSYQFFYSLLDGTASDHLINNGMMEKIGSRDLVLVDLGYFGVPTFAEIDAKDAFLLTRLTSNTVPYRLDDETNKFVEVDLLELVQHVSYEAKEIKLYLKSGMIFLPVRLILEKVPEEVKAQRLRKLNKEDKRARKQSTKRTKILQGFNLHITTASVQDIPTESVRTFYTIRWQIELVFKSWKSNFKLDEVNGKRPERIKMMLYAKLLLIFIVGKITNLAKFYVWQKFRRELSEFQVARHFQITGKDWQRTIVKEPSKVADFLRNAFAFITTSCLKSRSRKRTYPIEMLEAMETALP